MNEDGYRLAYQGISSMFPSHARLCDLIASLRSPFSIPNPKSAKGYVFVPKLTKQVSIANVHKVEKWYSFGMHEKTVNQ